LRIGVISDVHANLIALQKVLEKLETCDIIISAGDVVGYYPYPNEVIEIFRQEKIESVMGNHDAAVVFNDYSDMNEIAKIAGIYTRKIIKKDNLEWLANLPISLKKSDFEVYHGIPADNELAYTVYLFPDDPLIEILLNASDKSIIVGHTHIPFIKKQGTKFFLNPGSVGQPRDGNPKASFAIFDTEKGEIILKRVSYNIDEVYEAIIKHGLPEFLGLRLFRGF